MAVEVQDTILLAPEIANLGRNNQVIVVELKGLLEQLTRRIIEVKLKLNEAGLKSPETYDSSFRAHVTLAEAKDNPPTDEQARELKAFQEWISARLDLTTLKVALDPSMPIQLMLAGASRPTPIPEYITVESFLLIK
jgi:2'-5' RNA ligase